MYAKGKNAAAPVATTQMVYDNDGNGDLYDEPAFAGTVQKENPLFSEGDQPPQSVYEGGDYGDYGQPAYQDYGDLYNEPTNPTGAESGYNYFDNQPTYGNDEFGNVAGTVIANSQPMYGNEEVTGFAMSDAAGFEGEGFEGDGYLDVAPDPANDSEPTYGNDGEPTYGNE